MPNNPLASLKDLHLPPPPLVVLPAPGWIALFLLGFFLLTILFIYVVKRYAKQRAKRQALRLLEQTYHDYLKHGQLPQVTAEINILLRRVALAYYPRQQVAQLYGEAWLDFLTHTAKQIEFQSVRKDLLIYPYQKAAHPLALESRAERLKPLLNRAQAWIKQRGRHV